LKGKSPYQLLLVYKLVGSVRIELTSLDFQSSTLTTSVNFPNWWTERESNPPESPCKGVLRIGAQPI
jgi:hypothetical protein